MLGANLYSPVFSQRFYLAEVQENAAPGSRVIQVSLSFHCSQYMFSSELPACMALQSCSDSSVDFQVRATDEDSGFFGQITYSFVNDLGKTKFTIDADGVITTLQKLDRENPLYKDMVLTIMALDGGGIIFATDQAELSCFLEKIHL